MNTRTRIEILAWLYIAFGALIVVGGLLGGVGMILGGLFSGDLGTMIGMPIAGVVTALVVGIWGLPSLVIGWGLLTRRSWARVLALIVGAFNFLSFPLGTLLCIFTFYTLWGKDSDPYFERYYPSHYE
jgi:hypothetical protein